MSDITVSSSNEKRWTKNIVPNDLLLSKKLKLHHSGKHLIYLEKLLVLIVYFKHAFWMFAAYGMFRIWRKWFKHYYVVEKWLD